MTNGGNFTLNRILTVKILLLCLFIQLTNSFQIKAAN